MIRLSVTLRDKNFVSIQTGNDGYSDEALSQAAGLAQEFGVELCTSAAVDRFDGLVLVFVQPNVTTRNGWHFRTAICGYDGTGPIVSARILALFGFGSYDQIYERICQGGDNANFEFTK